MDPESVGGVRRRVRRGRRTAQVASVLARHGLGYLAAVADPRRARPDELGAAGPLAEAGRSAEAAADLGPAFVRVAQLASRRVDVLGPLSRAQLAAVEVREPAPSPADVELVLDEQLGERSRVSLDVEVGAALARTPTSWTFAGHLVDQADVQLTMRPLGLVSRVELDLAIAAPAVRLMARRNDVEGRLDLVAAFERIAAQVRTELDLSVAAHVLERAAEASPGSVPVVAEVVWQHCGPGLLVVADPPPSDHRDEGERAGRLAAALLGMLADDSIVVLDLAGAVDHRPLRLSRPIASVALPADVARLLRRLVGALVAADDDAVVDLLAATAERRAVPTAVLDGPVRAALAAARHQAMSLPLTLEAVLAVAGGAGLSFDADLLFAVGALVELDALVRAEGGPALDPMLAATLAEPVEPASAPARAAVRRPSERGSSSCLGFALSGGAVRGAAHVGAIAALAEAGVRPDLVVGSSAGAIIGALLAAGHDAAELARIVSTMRWSTVARPVPSRLALFDTAPMEAFLDRYLGGLTFADLLCPFAAVACDLATGERVVLDEGPVAPAVRASAALPGAFPPVELGGRLLVDGGVIDNVPVDVAYACGADVVVAIDVSAPVTDRRPTSVLDVLSMASGIMTKLQERGRRPPDVLVRVDLADLATVADVPAMQERARAATEAQLPGLLDALARREVASAG